MGGLVPLGYDPHPDAEIRSLVVNPIEDETVTALFHLYDTFGALGAVAREADRLRLRSKRRIDKAGNQTGDRRFSNGQIHHLLRNPLYIGQIRHKDQLWHGQHPPIVGHDLRTRVQVRLDAASRRGRSQSTLGTPPTAMLAGKLRDECGDRLTPTHRVKGSRRHRYYVSNRLIAGGVDPTGWRLPAASLEQSIAAGLVNHLQTQAQTHALLSEPDASIAEALLARVMLLTDQLRAHPVEAAALITEVRLMRTSLRITCGSDPLADRIGVQSDNLAPAALAFDAPFSLRRRGVETRSVSGALTAARDPTLLKNLSAAHGWIRSLLVGTPISAINPKTGHAESHIRTRSQLAFLSPRLQAEILAGSLSPDLTLKRLLARSLPLDWDEQEKLCGLPPL
ncbi:recombinase family protein [Sulfitobacter sp. HNIBRBA3233]|uniref:recombinase family protein n=1 Tax=Sulfitobacter marinivivus TaxID=3158558 RepID=UPI0032DEC25C